MAAIMFKDGILKVDPVNEKDLSIYLTFDPMNKQGVNNIALLNAIPPIKGLRRKSNRVSAAYYMLSVLESNGFEITKIKK